MLFNSYVFLLVYLPAALGGFAFLTGRHAWSTALFLALGSLVFYAWSSPLSHVAIMGGSIVFNFLVGRCIAASRNAVVRKAWLASGIGVDLALLCFYKYAGFLLLQLGLKGGLTDVVLPLGISFYTFTQIAFLVDVHGNKAREYDFMYYLLFVTWFPHLIAGPILHHKEMITQFRSRFLRPVRWPLLLVGLSIFAVGLAKKMLLADLVAPFADAVFGNATQMRLSFWEAWTGALAYAAQIYFDFSGYSDMAVGLSLMFGVRLPQNFNSPYKATSIIDFWRRWHITLSRFLRDYVYIPLGGNRRGARRRWFNLMATMVIGGFWHGAGWTFIVWGGLHGLYLAVNHAWRQLGVPLPRFAGAALTFLAVVFAWVFFRAADFAAAWAVLKPMLLIDGISFDGLTRDGIVPVRSALVWVGMLLALAFIAPNTQQIFRRVKPTLDGDDTAYAAMMTPPHGLEWRPTVIWAGAIGLLLASSFVKLGGDSPFLYFRF